MKELLTVSRLKAFHSCPFRAHLRYQLGWREIKVSDALTFGTAAHEALEAWWTAPDGERLTNALNRAIVDDKYQEEKLHAMLVEYDNCWRGEVGLYDVMAVEIEFNLPLINPMLRLHHEYFTMAGKIDAVVRDRATQMVCIVEHKTTSDDVSDPTHDYWLRLQNDEQISHYYWGASGAMEEEIQGALYDVLRKPQVKPKRKTPEHKLKYRQDGKLYANCSLTDEDPSTYGFRVAAKLAENPRDYFLRRAVPRTQGELVNYLMDLWQWANLMEYAIKQNNHPRNPDACAPRGGFRCSFYEHCVLKRPLEDFCEIHEDKHPELKQG